jgi:hypothetical protein
MTRQVPVDKPLSDSDREYLHARGEHDRVEYIDNMHGKAGDAAAGENVFEDEEDDRPYEEWTAAELDAEIDVRNNAPGRSADKRLAKSGKVADKAARLRSDDAWLDSQA